MFLRKVPKPPINEFVDSFYYINIKSQILKERIHPTYYPEILINLGPEFFLEMDGKLVPVKDTICITALNKPIYLINITEVKVLGMRYKPHTLSLMSDLENDDLFDNTFDPLSICDTIAPKIYNIDFTRALDKILIEIESIFLHNLPAIKPEIKIVKDFIDFVECSKGVTNINEVEYEISACRRSLERQFKKFTGFSPYRYIQIYRLRKMLQQYDNRSKLNLEELAFQYGFSDRQHLHKWVKNITGLKSSAIFDPNNNKVNSFLNP